MKLLAPFALLVLGLTAVVWFDEASGEADLVFVNQNEVFTLDPQRMSYVQDLRLAHVLYEGLVRWDNSDFSIEPAAAVALPAVSADGLRYRFRIRPEARWSNGDPVTAYDFVYSWRRAILPDTAADYSNMFFVIDGARAFFEWRTRQTSGFAADPWSPDHEPEPSTVLAVVDRVERLLGAADLPPGIAAPGADDRAGIAAELQRLRAAAAEGGPALAIARQEAPLVRAWWQRLDDAASRGVEGRWMWNEAERRFADTVALRAVDEATLEIRLTAPVSYFLDLLCFGVFFPVHRPTVEGWDPDEDIPAGGWHLRSPPPFARCRWVGLGPRTGRLEQKHQWTKPGRHVGNGTHRLKQWRYKRDVLLERNPMYHDLARVKTNTILALTVEETNTAVLAFESGHIDWLADVSADYQTDMLEELDNYVERYRSEFDARLAEGLSRDEALALLPEPDRGRRERRNIHKFPTFGTDFYSFNCRPRLSDGRPNPFRLAAVRRAFVLSVDKQTIVDRVTRLGEPVLTSFVPPGTIPGYEPPPGLQHDPDRARRELQDAGWEDHDGDGFVEDQAGRPFPVVDLLYTTNIPRYKWISLDLKAQWEQELGVRVELRGQETKFYKEDLKQGKFMIARGRWYGDYGDPTTFLELFRSTDGNNDRKYDNPVYDRMLDETALETDPVERMKKLAECERLIVQDDVPVLVLCQLVQVYMYEPGRVRGLSDHPRLTQFLWQMQVQK